MKNIYKILLMSLVMSFAACDELDDNLIDPVSVSPESVDFDLLYTSIQLQAGDMMDNAWFFPASISRMVSNTSAFEYLNAAAPPSFNGFWNNVYEDIWPDVDALTTIAQERNIPIHEGTAKIIKAYTMFILVDLFGDVPNTEATQGIDIISPVADNGADVYASAIELLDEAIQILQNVDNAPVPDYDNFYDGDVDKWIALANTLKLRAAVTTRLVNPSESASIINSLIGQDLIDTEAEDFQFSYGLNRVLPNSRHPLYNEGGYENTDGDYMSNYYMWLLRGEKLDDAGNPVIDPRIRYYFYRQTEDASVLSDNEYSCHLSVRPDISNRPPYYEEIDSRMPYCVAFEGDGYFGRDHLNNQGIPPDGNLRTIYGIYPVGGLFDANTFENQQQAGITGARGQGIWPIMLSSYTDFLRAEAALTLGTNDDARALLQSGIEKSIAKVQGFESRDPETFNGQIDQRGVLIGIREAFVPTAEDVAEYVDYVMERYDAADADGKLDILMKEYYIALWGNGVEAYNMYRRTGKPNNMMPAIETNPGDFIRSFFYPQVNVDRNQNVQQKNHTDPVFWDNGSVILY